MPGQRQCEAVGINGLVTGNTHRRRHGVEFAVEKQYGNPGDRLLAGPLRVNPVRQIFALQCVAVGTAEVSAP